MLYALASPLSLLLLLGSFLVAVTLYGTVGALVADRTGQRQVRAEGRRAPDPRRHLDPFGAVAALLAGFGWGKRLPAPDRQRRGALLAVVSVPSAVLVAVGLALLVAFAAVSGLPPPAASSLLQDGAPPLAALDELLLLAGLMHLYVGVLALVPLPPLPGAQLLFALAPRTRGWQQAEYQLDERNIGTVVVLLLMVLPLAGRQPLLPYLLDVVLDPVVQLVAG